MKLPDYYDLVPRLRVRDPLAYALGAAEEGILEYGYGDAVRLAGHSCPTVAAAYWLTWLALERLYPEALPERGGISVEMRDSEADGSTGVAACVIQMLTGAAGQGGFKGIGGRYGRSWLQRYTPDLPLTFRFTRIDTGVGVDVAADLQILPADPQLNALIKRCARGDDDSAMFAELGARWQARVRHLLLDLGRDPGVFIVRSVERRRPWRTATQPADTGSTQRRVF